MKYLWSLIVASAVTAGISFADVSVSGEYIREKLESYIESSTDSKRRLKIIELPEVLYLPDSNFAVEYQSDMKLGDRKGLLNIIGEGWKRGVFWRYSCEIRSYYFEAKRDLNPGICIGDDDISMLSGWISDINLVTDIDDVIGKDVKSSIRKGTPITKRDLKRYYDVQVCQVVDVRWGNDVINLSTDGKSLQKGTIGSIIPVRVNNKILKAEITAPGEVIIK